MTSILVRLFIQNPENVTHPETRSRYGSLASVTGAAVNLILFALKFLLGFLSGSIAITADAFNNLSDIGSAAVTFLGFKLASHPPDKKHPFGYGRAEYLSGLLIAIFVILVGVEIVKSSIHKIMHPETVAFSWVLILGLALSIAIKLWLGLFYGKIGRKINSTSLLAASTDSKSDCISTTATLAGLLILRFFSVNLDAWLGLLVACLILKAGYDIVKETISPLLGRLPDEKLVKQIETILNSYDICVGIHDMVIHDYGPGRLMGSVHMEVPADCDIMEAHDQIDNAEREVQQNLNMPFVIHMDPVQTNSPEVLTLKEKVAEVLGEVDENITFHDFRVVHGETHTNLIFDVVPVPGGKQSNAEIRAALEKAFASHKPPVYCVLTFDQSYVR